MSTQISDRVRASDVERLTARAASTEVQRFIFRPQLEIRHTVTEGCEFQSHSHSGFTITTVLQGRMVMMIGQQASELSEGQSALTNVNQTHSAQASQVEFVSITVNSGLVNELVAEAGLTSANAEIVFRDSITSDETIAQTASEVALEITNEQPGHEVVLDALVRKLVIHLLRNHLTVRKSSRIELSRAGPVDRRLRRAIEFMHDNFDRDLALEEIAAAAYLSEYHFARLFKQITGLTPHVYLANLRLERARKLLAETALPIGEIAATVGYRSQSHFTKVFKSVTGVTPRAYREGTN